MNSQSAIDASTKVEVVKLPGQDGGSTSESVQLPLQTQIENAIQRVANESRQVAATGGAPGGAPSVTPGGAPIVAPGGAPGGALGVVPVKKSDDGQDIVSMESSGDDYSSDNSDNTDNEGTINNTINDTSDDTSDDDDRASVGGSEKSTTASETASDAGTTASTGSTGSTGSVRSVATTDLLASSSLFMALSQFLMTPDRGANITSVLSDIRNELKRINVRLKKMAPRKAR